MAHSPNSPQRKQGLSALLNGFGSPRTSNITATPPPSSPPGARKKPAKANETAQAHASPAIMALLEGGRDSRSSKKKRKAKEQPLASSSPPRAPASMPAHPPGRKSSLTSGSSSQALTSATTNIAAEASSPPITSELTSRSESPPKSASNLASSGTNKEVLSLLEAPIFRLDLEKPKHRLYMLEYHCKRCTNPEHKRPSAAQIAAGTASTAPSSQQHNCIRYHDKSEKTRRPLLREDGRLAYWAVLCRRGHQCPNPKCEYAHGYDELNFHPAVYKSTFQCTTTGGAKKCFGDRCSFAHSDDDLRPRELYSMYRPPGVLNPHHISAAAVAMATAAAAAASASSTTMSTSTSSSPAAAAIAPLAGSPVGSLTSKDREQLLAGSNSAPSVLGTAGLQGNPNGHVAAPLVGSPHPHSALLGEQDELLIGSAGTSHGLIKDARHEFDWKTYKTIGPCKAHDRPTMLCPLWHNELDRRRPLAALSGTAGGGATYGAKDCPDWRRAGTPAGCPRGDTCPFFHSQLEKMYHPDFYKTAFCSAYDPAIGAAEPACKKGKLCAFAHSRADCRSPLLDEREIAEAADGTAAGGVSTPTTDARVRFYVRRYKTLRCPYSGVAAHDAAKCPYAHTAKDHRRDPLQWRYSPEPCPALLTSSSSSSLSSSPLATSGSLLASSGSGDGGIGGVPAGSDASIKGKCERYPRCPYAHSPMERCYHPDKYKTLDCDFYAKHGWCPRGRDCAFVHDPSERRNPAVEGLDRLLTSADTASADASGHPTAAAVASTNGVGPAGSHAAPPAESVHRTAMHGNADDEFDAMLTSPPPQLALADYFTDQLWESLYALESTPATPAAASATIQPPQSTPQPAVSPVDTGETAEIGRGSAGPVVEQYASGMRSSSTEDVAVVDDDDDFDLEGVVSQAARGYQERRMSTEYGRSGIVGLVEADDDDDTDTAVFEQFAAVSVGDTDAAANWKAGVARSGDMAVSSAKPRSYAEALGIAASAAQPIRHHGSGGGGYHGFPLADAVSSGNATYTLFGSPGGFGFGSPGAAAFAPWSGELPNAAVRVAVSTAGAAQPLLPYNDIEVLVLQLSTRDDMFVAARELLRMCGYGVAVALVDDPNEAADRKLAPADRVVIVSATDAWPRDVYLDEEMLVLNLRSGQTGTAVGSGGVASDMYRPLMRKDGGRRVLIVQFVVRTTQMTAIGWGRRVVEVSLNKLPALAAVVPSFFGRNNVDTGRLVPAVSGKYAVEALVESIRRHKANTPLMAGGAVACVILIRHSATVANGGDGSGGLSALPVGSTSTSTATTPLGMHGQPAMGPPMLVGERGTGADGRMMGVPPQMAHHPMMPPMMLHGISPQLNHGMVYGAPQMRHHPHGGWPPPPGPMPQPAAPMPMPAPHPHAPPGTVVMGWAETYY